MATLAANTYKLKLSFSTQVCTDWTVPAIVDGMSTFKYDGVEFQLGEGHLHGVEAEASAEFLQDVRGQFDEAGKAICCLATNINFASPDAKERAQAVESMKLALRTANTLGAPFVRCFGGEVPEVKISRTSAEGGLYHENRKVEIAGLVDFVSEALSEIADYIETNDLRSIAVMETAGPFSNSKYVLEVMNQVYSKKVAVLWNVLNTMRVLEKVETTFDRIGEYVRHVHIREGVYNDDRTRIVRCGIGEGMAPFSRVVDLLKAGRYRGFLSVHVTDKESDSDIEMDPDEFLPEYSEYLRGFIEPKEE